MNIYYKRQIRCITCGKFIGEVDDDAKILFSRCGNCMNSNKKENEIFLYITNKFENTIKNVIICE